MNKTTKLIIGVIIILTVIVIGWSIYKSQVKLVSTEPIKIGVIVPLTGEAATYGDVWKKGVELAVEKIENEYGIKIEAVYEDSQMLPANTVTAAQKLINIDKVKAIVIGSSRETLAAAPVAENNKILLMSAATSPEITKAGDYVFRIYPSDLYQGNDLADLAAKKGYTKLAVLAVLDDYGKGLTEVFKTRVEKEGGKVEIVENFIPEGAMDFRTQLTKIAGIKPEAVLILAYKIHYPSILKQMQELNIHIPILASEAMYDPDVLKNVGKLAEGILLTNYTEPKTKEYEEFVLLHKEKYDTEQGAFSAGFYDNTILVLKALIENKGDVEQAKNWLYNVKDWHGATGTTNFDENGDVVGKSYTVYTVKNGQFVPYGE